MVTESLCNQNEEMIEKMGCVRDMIDFQFQETSKIQFCNLLIFLGLYVFPFMYQLILDLDEKSKNR